MVILIAGANGLIGRDLVKNLSKNYKIIAIYRSNKKNIIKNKNVQFIKHDFSKNLKFSLSLMPDYLVNCIATHEFSKKKNYFEY